MGRRTVFGFVVLMAGIGFLLQQTGLLHLKAAWLTGSVIWPWLLVLLGFGGLKEFRRGRIPWGALFFIVLGVLLSLKAAVVLPGWLESIGGWSLFWSLALIFAGLSFITPRRLGQAWWPITIETGGKRSRKPSGSNEDEFVDIEGPWEDGDDRHRNRERRRAERNERRRARWDWRERPWRTDHRWIGDLSLGRQPWVLRNLDLWNGIGDVRLNLATAHVEDGHYDIEIRGLIGDVRVLVPENLPVLVEAEVGIGDIEVFGEKHSGTKRAASFEDPGYETASRQCHITIALRIGDVEVVRV